LRSSPKQWWTWRPPRSALCQRTWASIRAFNSMFQPHFYDLDCKQIGVATFHRFNPIVR
jgi:hypothetical protein